MQLCQKILALKTKNQKRKVAYSKRRIRSYHYKSRLFKKPTAGSFKGGSYIIKESCRLKNGLGKKLK